MVLPLRSEDPSLYTDWHDPREFTIGDMGVGECAGEVVSPLEFQLTACEREVFEAQLAHEKGDIETASRLAYESMLHGAEALLAWRNALHTATPDGSVEGFRAGVLRHPAILRSLCGRQVRALLLCRSRTRGQALYSGIGAPADRGSATLYRGVPQLHCQSAGCGSRIDG